MNSHDGWSITSESLAILQAIIEAPAACVTAADLAEAAGLTQEETALQIDHLLSTGWLESWLTEDHMGAAFTLTPLAASRLGATLTGGDGTDLPHWGWASDPGPPHPPRSRRSRSTFAPSQDALERIPDPTPDPSRIVCLLDYLEHILDQIWPSKAKRARAAWERLPNPTVLVGLTNTAYLPKDDFVRPNPDMGRYGNRYPQNLQEGRTCPGCEGRPLRPFEVCPRCSRWGLDSLFKRLIHEGANPRVA